LAAKVGEKVPGWVERILIPSLDSRVRSIVDERFSQFEKVFDARMKALDEKVATKTSALDQKIDGRSEALEAKVEALGAKIDSLAERFPLVQEVADIKARLTLLEKSRN